MKTLLVVLTLTLSASAVAGDPDLNSPEQVCHRLWLANLSKQHLPTKGQILDFSSKGVESDKKFGDDIEGGRATGLIDMMARKMKEGANNPTSMTLVGPALIIKPMLADLAPQLKGARLPYLTVLYVGPPEMEREVESLITQHEGSFKYVPNTPPQCASEKK